MLCLHNIQVIRTIKTNMQIHENPYKFTLIYYCIPTKIKSITIVRVFNRLLINKVN